MKKKIKRILLGLPPISHFNRTVKARNQRNRYLLWSKAYAGYQVTNAVNTKLLYSFRTSNLHIRFNNVKTGSKLRVFYIGADESQDRTGFLQALSRFAECEIFHQRDGKYGQYPGIPGESGARTQMSLELESRLSFLADKGWIPDVLLMQAWGFTFEKGTLSKIKKRFGCFVINIGMDERLIFSHGNLADAPNDGLIGIARECDLVLVTSPECVGWYESEGIPAYYFPLASDPSIYYPQQIEKVYDIGFIGNCYGLRETMIMELRRRGLQVQAHGTGWEAGRIDYRDNNKFFNSCRIILGIGNVGYCEDLYTLKLRDFDALMSGGVYVTHDHPTLASLFRNEQDLILCKNIDEFEIKLRTLLNNKDMRERISLSAASVARKHHSYERRFENLLQLFAALHDEHKTVDRSIFLAN